jgi:CRP-like cAMP-binding protein
MSRHELDLIGRMKRTHLTVPAGDDLVREGDLSRTFYTVFDGWGARYHRHRNGSRQILDVLLPGDTIALASVLLGSSAYSVQALTAASFCALDGKQFVALFNSNPKFALSILTTRLDDGRRADKRLTMLGRMSAVERVGYFLVEIYDRLLQRGMAGATSCPLPLRRTDVADAVGLSRIHVMRALRELRSQNLVDIKGRDMIIPDASRLAAHTGYIPVSPGGTRAIL